MRIYRDESRAALAREAMQEELASPGLAASGFTPYLSLTDADIEVRQWGSALAEMGDDYGVGLAMLRACSAGMGEPHAVVKEGDVQTPSDAPLLVHGDLRVEGSLVNASQLLVTGNLSVGGTFYNHGYATVLGRLESRGITTGGHCYVAGTAQTEVLWAGDFSDSWFLTESTRARVFIEAPSHAMSNGSTVASVRASINEDNECPLEMLLADVFEPDLYGADGMPLRDALFGRIDSGGPVFRESPGTGSRDVGITPLPFSVFERWLTSRYRGTQKEKLEQLETRWLPRMSRFEPGPVRSLLTGYFKSPKRRADLQRLLAAIEARREEPDHK